MIDDLVLAEVYYALQSYYQVPKADALAAIAAFAAIDGIQVSAAAHRILALPNPASAKPGFVARLIHAASQTANATLVTFEKAAARLPGTLVLAQSAAPA